LSFPRVRACPRPNRGRESITNFNHMDSKTTISISEARKKIFDIATEVQAPGKHYTLTENGRPKVVIMSVEEFESWMETMEIMREFPDIKKDIARAEREYKSGNYITLEDLLEKEGYVLADKTSKNYAVSDHSAKKRTKGPRKA